MARDSGSVFRSFPSLCAKDSPMGGGLLVRNDGRTRMRGDSRIHAVGPDSIGGAAESRASGMEAPESAAGGPHSQCSRRGIRRS